MSGFEGNGRESDEPIETGAGAGNSAEDAEELSLVEDDEPLPWLESSDYGDEDEGVDTGRIVGFVLIAALALLALFGAIWFFSNRTSDSGLVADGSTIEAPAGTSQGTTGRSRWPQFRGDGRCRARSGRRPDPRRPDCREDCPQTKRFDDKARRRGSGGWENVIGGGASGSKRHSRPGWRLFEQGGCGSGLECPQPPDRRSAGL